MTPVNRFTNERFVYKDTGKFKAKLLPERYKKIFRAKQIVCMQDVISQAITYNTLYIYRYVWNIKT